MKAIEKSSERNLLLIGDPGAGKSVALRHLAMQLIEKSLKSQNIDAPIPLYINLREFSLQDNIQITIDNVKEFVIDNARRGDADTAEYIKENWVLFREKGIWFFLFDSFDEIPAVLHSAAGDSLVHTYGKAIQMFMSGIGSCRGVIASREYKRPTSLDWPVLRILPLNISRQEELVSRTFLSNSEKETAVRAMTLSFSATYKNPLFLTLLCKYVKNNKVSPKNEHNLLMDHVKALSKRDSDYVQKKWNMTDQNLMDGAAEIAFAFATSPNLGLYPTVEEIYLEMKSLKQLSSQRDFHKTMEALTYVKIGRTDISGQDISVRRFAFSHRRYQECLYAHYLSSNIDKVNLNELLVDPRWREYVVAILQVGENSAVESLVASAVSLVEVRSKTFKRKTVEYHGERFSINMWEDAVLEHVLSIFLEAMRYNPEGPWSGLERPIEELFSPLWRNGDYFDRCKIIEYSALGSKESLVDRLEFSIRSGIPILEQFALDACRFLPRPSDMISGWVRMRIATRMIGALSRQEYLKWEAISAQLPSGYNCRHSIRRAAQLNYSSNILVRFISLASRPIEAFFTYLSPVINRVVVDGENDLDCAFYGKVLLLKIFVIYFFLASASIIIKLSSNVANMVIVAFVLSAPIYASARMFIQLIFLDHPEKITASHILKKINSRISDYRRVFSSVTMSFVAISLPVISIYGISKFFNFFHGNEFVYSVIIVFSILVVVGFFLLIDAKASEIRSKKSLEEIIKNRKPGISKVRLLRKMKTGGNLFAMTKIVSMDLSDEVELRSIVTYLSSLVRILGSKKVRGGLKWIESDSGYYINKSLSLSLECAHKSNKARIDRSVLSDVVS